MKISWLLFATTTLFAILHAEEEGVSPLRRPSKPPPEGTYVTPESPKYDYAEVLHKSYLFYHSQKSGVLPYQRLAWRSDSCKLCVGDFGEDLSRAWYEAANTMKWGLPLGWTITQLAFNIYTFEDSMRSVDELAEGLELLRWGAGIYYNVKNTNNLVHITKLFLFNSCRLSL